MKVAPFIAILLAASSAHAAPFGPTAELGIVSTPELDKGSFNLRSMSGPLAQVGFQVGDWWNSQFMFQFTNVTGRVDFPGSPLTARDHVQTLLGGYQLTFDVFGKQGAHGFTPFIGGGLLFGTAHVDVQSSSTDPLVEAQLESSGAKSQNRDGLMLELHAVAGLRYHLGDALGIHGELGYSTYGGFFGTWEPKLGLDYVF